MDPWGSLHPILIVQAPVLRGDGRDLDRRDLPLGVLGVSGRFGASAAERIWGLGF